MFPLGHMGLTLGLAVLLVRLGWLGPDVDARALLVGSLLPDFVDKPLAVVLGIDGRSVAHSLFVVTLLTLVFVVPRAAGRPASEPLPQRLAHPLPLVAFGLWTHLLFDRMWHSTHALFWPFQGLGFPPGGLDLAGLLASLGDFYVLGGEVAGLVVFALLFVTHRLYRWPNLRRVLLGQRPQ